MARNLESQVTRLLQKADLPFLRGQEAASTRIVAGICGTIRELAVGATMRPEKVKGHLLQAAGERIATLGVLFHVGVLPSAEQNMLDTVRHALRCRMGLLTAQRPENEPAESHGTGKIPLPPVRMRWIKRGGNFQRLAVPIRLPDDEVA